MSGEPGLQERLAANLSAVRARIDRAAAGAGRPAAGVQLIAVSKTFGPDAVRAAAAAGQVDFGENRVQEALGKIEALADLPIRWHLVGHLQSNKAKKAVGPFARIHSLHSLDLLRRLDAAARDRQIVVEALVQADLAGEATKQGAPPAEVREILGAADEFPGVRILGLMLLPPFTEDPEDARPWFQRLRALQARLLDEGMAPERLRELSMGMSHDFEVAIQEGATIVRVGSAIFGSRQYV